MHDPPLNDWRELLPPEADDEQDDTGPPVEPSSVIRGERGALAKWERRKATQAALARRRYFRGG